MRFHPTAFLLQTILLCLLCVASFAEDYFEYYQQANRYEDVKNYPKAIEFYKKAVALEPRFAPALNGLGFVYLELEQYPQAREQFEKAIRLLPTFVLPLINLGAAYYREGKLTEAEKYFQKVLGQDPKNVRALTNIAVIRFKNMDYPGAVYFYTQAKAVDENYLKERYDKTKSLAELREARQHDPNNVYLKMLKEKLQYEEGVFLP